VNVASDIKPNKKITLVSAIELFWSEVGRKQAIFYAL
jgi:hypothetical protein